jgi:perosamine synthetase
MRLPDTIVQTLRATLGTAPVVLHEPWFRGNEWKYVKECIDTGWVSSVGSYVDRFERDLAELTGCAHAVAVANGTAGLQVALEVCGVRSGDEVLVPALSFVATANAVKHCGAEPHFVESDPASLGLCVASLADYLSEIGVARADGCYNKRSGRRITAVVPMHTFGHPVDMPALLDLAARYGIVVVEDAAESLGSLIGRQHTGTFGRCGVLSFNGNKIVTTGGGGAILTNDPQLARRAKHLTTTARQSHRWAFLHDEVAYNFRMPNLNAALGCAQLEGLADFVKLKRRLAERYQLAFAKVQDVTVFIEREGTHSNYWLQTLILGESVADQRDPILEATNQGGLMTRPVWELLPRLPMYRECACMPIAQAESLARRIINLPSGPQLMAVPG